MARVAWLREHRHLLLGWMWVGLLVPTLLWWKESILWVAVMSIYANVEASFAAHEGRRQRGDDSKPVHMDATPHEVVRTDDRGDGT